MKKKNRLNHTTPTTPHSSAGGKNGHSPGQPPQGEPDGGRIGSTERRGDSRSESPRSAGDPTSRADSPQPAPATRPASDPEVAERPRRRVFSAEEKLRILRAADACEPGGLGALLRREGLYSSYLTEWRRQREAGELGALTPRKRGAKPKRSALEVENERLRRENERLEDRLRKAELIIGAQKKVAQIFEEYSSQKKADENERSGSSS